MAVFLRLPADEKGVLIQTPRKKYSGNALLFLLFLLDNREPNSVIWSFNSN